MNKIFLLLFFSFLFGYKNLASAQDTLQQYSYMIVGIDNPRLSKNGDLNFNTPTGTCFFIRIKNRLLLVSAKHVLTPWEPNVGTKSPIFPDTLYIRFENEKSHSFEFEPIDVTKIKDTISGGNAYNDPDVFVIEYTNPSNRKLNSIEKFFAPISEDDISIACMVGYPSHEKSFQTLLFRKAVSMNAEILNSINKPNTINDNVHKKTILDTLNYIIKPINGTPEPGFSGSPVFIKSKSSNSWLFGGIVSQGVLEDNFLMIVKPQIVAQKIIEYLH